MPEVTPDAFGALARRPVLASFTHYAQAQECVDTLSDNGFPVQNVAIVGVDLRIVESVLGRWSWGRAALSGMASGAWFGLLLGLFVSLFAAAESSTSQLLFIGLLFGGAFGIVFALISFGLTRGKRDFVSRQSLVANRYDVVCETDVISQARQVINGGRPVWPPPLPTEDPTQAPDVPPPNPTP